MSGIKSDLARYARSLGFDRFGVTAARDLKPEELYLKQWVKEGRAATMDYMKHDPERRARPQRLLPTAKSAISLAMTYELAGEGETPLAWTADPFEKDEGRVARYVSGTDYHKVMTKRLESFVRYLSALAPDHESRVFVDTGPILERALAQRAGTGFVGKNTMLITRGLGSWVFLGSVLTTLELDADAPDDRSCGECRLCIDACPTQAITEPYHLDARLCIAYLTIEHRDSVHTEQRSSMGPWVFGCDVCQEVCPHNAGRTPAAQSVHLAEVFDLEGENEFRERFAGTAILRAGHRGLIRNACVAAANLGRQDLVPQLKKIATGPDRDLRECAEWALQQLRSI